MQLMKYHQHHYSKLLLLKLRQTLHFRPKMYENAFGVQAQPRSAGVVLSHTPSRNKKGEAGIGKRVRKTGNGKKLKRGGEVKREIIFCTLGGRCPWLSLHNYLHFCAAIRSNLVP